MVPSPRALTLPPLFRWEDLDRETRTLSEDPEVCPHPNVRSCHVFRFGVQSGATLTEAYGEPPLSRHPVFFLKFPETFGFRGLGLCSPELSFQTGGDVGSAPGPCVEPTKGSNRPFCGTAREVRCPVVSVYPSSPTLAVRCGRRGP